MDITHVSANRNGENWEKTGRKLVGKWRLRGAKASEKGRSVVEAETRRSVGRSEGSIWPVRGEVGI